MGMARDGFSTWHPVGQNDLGGWVSVGFEDCFGRRPCALDLENLIVLLCYNRLFRTFYGSRRFEVLSFCMLKQTARNL
jgi:hypothetical protein